jgi:hypothetical protein
VKMAIADVAITAVHRRPKIPDMKPPLLDLELFGIYST